MSYHVRLPSGRTLNLTLVVGIRPADMVDPTAPPTFVEVVFAAMKGHTTYMGDDARAICAWAASLPIIGAHEEQP